MWAKPKSQSWTRSKMEWTSPRRLNKIQLETEGRPRSSSVIVVSGRPTLYKTEAATYWYLENWSENWSENI